MMNRFFTKNMENRERAVRISLGAIIVLATFFNLAQVAGWVAMLLIATGAILIIEGILAWCPVRAFLGLDSQHSQR